MAGSIEDNAALYKNKAFIYVPPSPPADLFETTSYTLDFANRKFVHIGIDSTEKYQVVDPSEKNQVVVIILTASRYVKISPDFLQRIFSMMEDILPFVLDAPQKYKRTIFLETEFHKISSMVYCGENVLVIESKIENGCRIILNRTDLIRLLHLECCIFESIARKTIYTARLVKEQTDEFVAYLREKCDLLNSPPKNLDEMMIFVKNAKDERTDKSFPNLTAQIQMFAAKQLAESLLNRATHESQNGEMVLPMSPSSIHDDPLLRIATLRPSDSAAQYQLQEILSPQPIDVNDGPEYFSQFRTPSPSQYNTTFAEHPTPVRNVRRRLF